MLHFLLKLLAPVTVLHSPSDEDEAFAAFVKGPRNFEQFCSEKGVTNAQSKLYLAQSYGTQLGIMYFVRKRWSCDGIEPVQEAEKCEQYRKYLAILYAYFCHISAGHSVEGPIFALPKGKPLKIVEATEHLAIAFQTVPKSWQFFSRNFFVELKNGDKLNYFNYYYGKSEKDDDEKTDKDKALLEGGDFDRKMEKMFKILAKKVAKLKVCGTGLSFASALSPPSESDHIRSILSDFPKFRFSNALKDEAFVEFLRVGMQTAIKFEHNAKETDSFEVSLVQLSLMKRHWQCENLVQKNGRTCATFDKRTKYKCEEKRRFVGILYEYLCQERYGISMAVKPMFQNCDSDRNSVIEDRPLINSLVTLTQKLNGIVRCYAGQCDSARKFDCKYNIEMALLNGDEVPSGDYAEKTAAENESSNIDFDGTVFEVINSLSVGNRTNDPFVRKLLRIAFQNELEALRGKWLKRAREPAADVEEAVEAVQALRSSPFWG